MAKHGRYKIVRKVADGGMAEIFLATQIGREGFQKPVILKRIHSTIYADPQFRNMFIDEAHISMGLSHSNIVQILDLGVGNGRYFLVMEVVDGWDLGRVLQRAATAGTPLPRELGLYVTAEICRALAYAHGKMDAEGLRPLGIVHRDVSPQNILLSEQGEVKLTDFGIAKAMGKREQTGTGVVKGKVAFMSPEQALGKAIDARSDLFAVGTVLYQLMVGVRPFEAPTDLEILLRVQKADFKPAHTVARDLPPQVSAIIARSMQLDPDLRYQSADEMLIDIEQVMRTVFRPVGQTELKRWLAERWARATARCRWPKGPRRHRTGAPRAPRARWRARTSSSRRSTSRKGDVAREHRRSRRRDAPAHDAATRRRDGAAGSARRRVRSLGPHEPARVSAAAVVRGRRASGAPPRAQRRRHDLPLRGAPHRRGRGVRGALLPPAARQGARTRAGGRERHPGRRHERQGRERRTAAKPAADDPAVKTAGEPDAGAGNAGAGNHLAARKAEEHGPAREPSAHHARGSAEKPEHLRRIDEIKNMMAPDPSLDPAPAPSVPAPAPPTDNP